jgi:hypothetical protein
VVQPGSPLGELAETHIRLTVKLPSTYTVLENTEGSRRFATGCVYSGGHCLDIYCFQMKFEENIEINYKIFNFRFIVDSFHQKPLKFPG